MLLFLLGSLGWSVPLQMTQQGRVLDATGAAYEGVHTFEIRIFDAETGGHELWDEVQAVNTITIYAYKIKSP